jgi:uracil-DNA glycosylase
MDVIIEPSWKRELSNEFSKPYFASLTEFVKKEYATHTCYPPASKVFAAFDHCPFDKVKVVIIGQDPYHGPGQANGLSFSVKDGIIHPPSLKNIFKELETDLNQPVPASGNLDHWASQGVLLLNATLTVRAHEAGSHQKQGWEKFTDAVIDNLSKKRKNIIFLLWGGFAKKKGKKIDVSKHHILTSGHPSPLSANRGYWFGNKHFSQVNELLMSQGEPGINW